MADGKNLSGTLYSARALALVSIVMAHSAYTGIKNDYIVALFARFSTVGVFTFMCLAGYFFNKDKYKNIGSWAKNKTKPMFVPWLVLGLLVYSTKFLIEGKVFFDPVGIINFLFGNGSYLYYMTVLVLCQIIMIYFEKNITFLILTVLSVAMTSVGAFPTEADASRLIFTYLNPYLNVFNWIGIFVLGMYLREYDLINKLLNMSLVKKLMILLGAIVIFALSPTFDKISSSGYWSHFAIILELSMFVSLIILADWINNKWFADIGAKTMPVYMLHMLVIGKFSFLRESVWFAILRPCLCILTIYVIIEIGLFISKKIKLDKIYKLLLGIR